MTVAILNETLLAELITTLGRGYGGWRVISILLYRAYRRHSIISTPRLKCAGDGRDVPVDCIRSLEFYVQNRHQTATNFPYTEDGLPTSARCDGWQGTVFPVHLHEKVSNLVPKFPKRIHLQIALKSTKNGVFSSFYQQLRREN